jgi:hypothetical protein
MGFIHGDAQGFHTVFSNEKDGCLFDFDFGGH